MKHSLCIYWQSQTMWQITPGTQPCLPLSSELLSRRLVHTACVGVGAQAMRERGARTLSAHLKLKAAISNFSCRYSSCPRPYLRACITQIAAFRTTADSSADSRHQAPQSYMPWHVSQKTDKLPCNAAWSSGSAERHAQHRITLHASRQTEQLPAAEHGRWLGREQASAGRPGAGAFHQGRNIGNGSMHACSALVRSESA